VRGIPEIAFEIGDAGGRDRLGIDVARVQVLRRAEISVEGALAVGRDQHIAARGRWSLGRRRRLEIDAGGADVMGEGAAELVVLDLADEGCAPAQTRHPDDGVRRRAAGNLDRRSHGVVKRRRPRFVDERHRALAHGLLDQKVVVCARDHVDDGIADAEHIGAQNGH